MKRFIIAFIFSLISFSVFASITTKKEGPTLVVEFHKSPNDSITLDDVKIDFYEAIKNAKNKNVKNVFFRDTEKYFFFMIVGKNEINNPDKYWNNLVKLIDKEETNEFIEGEIISKKIVRKQISGAKYRSTTTMNGSKYSTYESDWNGDYFKPETSTYIVDGTTIKTTTQYIPAKYANVEEIERAPGHNIITSGIVNFVKKTYFEN